MDRNTKKALRWDSGYRAKPVKSNKASFSSGKYSMAFACLNCKSTFQRSFLEAPCDYPLHSQCASCGGVTYNLGRNFKAPKKLDTAQWRKVAYLIQHGFYFQKFGLVKIAITAFLILRRWLKHACLLKSTKSMRLFRVK